MDIEQHLDIFEQARPSMRDNNADLLRLGVLVETEFVEFLDSWLDLIVTPTQETAQEAGQEAADVSLYLAQCMRSIGSTLEGEMLDKIAYNTSRFLSVDFQEKPYAQGNAESKQWVKDVGWKKSYYMEPRIEYTVGDTKNKD